MCCFEAVQSWVGYSRKATKWKILPCSFQTVTYLTMKGLLASIMIRFSFMICSCCLVSTMWCFFRVFIANVLLSLASWTWRKFTMPLRDAVLLMKVRCQRGNFVCCLPRILPHSTWIFPSRLTLLRCLLRIPGEKRCTVNIKKLKTGNTIHGGRAKKKRKFGKWPEFWKY